MLDNTEWAINNEQSREIGNTCYKEKMKKKTK